MIIGGNKQIGLFYILVYKLILKVNKSKFKVNFEWEKKFKSKFIVNFK